MISTIQNLFIAAAESGRAIVKASESTEVGLTNGAMIMLAVGIVLLYGGLATCLVIAMKKGGKKTDASEEEEKKES